MRLRRLEELLFQYMLLLRGATSKFSAPSACPCVSIHAPLARSNSSFALSFQHRVVSIHAPLARSNNVKHDNLCYQTGFNTCSSCEEQLWYMKCAICNSRFQYMLLLRGATQSIADFRLHQVVSIHAPLARSNLGASVFGFEIDLFQYMLLLRGATWSRLRECTTKSFNTCSSCEEQLGTAFPLPRRARFQYMLLLRGATRRA